MDCTDLSFPLGRSCGHQFLTFTGHWLDSPSTKMQISVLLGSMKGLGWKAPPTSHPNIVAGLIPEGAMTIINSLCLITTIISILITKWLHIHVAGVPLAACCRNSKEIFPGTLQLLPHLPSLLATPRPGLERPKFTFFIFSNSEFPCFLQVSTKRGGTCHGRQGAPQRFPRSTNSTCQVPR